METKIVRKVSVTMLIFNFLLFLIKITAGIWGKSSALVSDAVHSLSDVFSMVIVMIGMKMSGKEADDDHQYGHERIECITAIILAALLIATGLGIGYDGLMKIVRKEYLAFAQPGIIALVVAVVSVATKEWMYRFTAKYAKQINSDALMASAWDNRSDALSSVGSFAGILGARIGFPVLDSVASVVICFLILKAAYLIASDAVNKLVDKACDSQTCERLRELILAQSGVVDIADLKTRLFGSKMYVDIVIETDADISLKEAHSIAENVHDEVEKEFPSVKHCMVHVDPADNSCE